MRISDWSSDVCSSDLDEFGRGRAVEVGTAKARSALEGAILVEDDALGDERHPGKIVGEGSGFGAIFGEVHHGRIQTGNLRWRRATSTNCGSCRAAQTERAWPIAQRARPAIQSRRPSPIAQIGRAHG